MERLEPKRAKQLRHIMALHGTKGVDGLTGRYNGRYYENGRPRKQEEPKPIDPRGTIKFK